MSTPDQSLLEQDPLEAWLDAIPAPGPMDLHGARFEIVTTDDENGLRLVTGCRAPALRFAVPHRLLGVAISATHPNPINLLPGLIDVWGGAHSDLITAALWHEILPEFDPHIADARWREAVARGATILGAKYTASIDREWHYPRIHLLLDPQGLPPLPTDRSGLAALLPPIIRALPPFLKDEPATFPPGFVANLFGAA